MFNILLQVLEEGHLNDNLGHKVNFKNTVIIMTSNLGAAEIRKGASLGFQAQDSGYEKMKDKVMNELKRAFRPEFINRVDDVVVFKHLNKDDLKKIIHKMIDELLDRLKDRKLTFELTDAAKDFLISSGYDPLLGARPLRRTIQRYIEDRLADEILKGVFKEEVTLRVDCVDGKLEFSKITNSEK